MFFKVDMRIRSLSSFSSLSSLSSLVILLMLTSLACQEAPPKSLLIGKTIDQAEEGSTTRSSIETTPITPSSEPQSSSLTPIEEAQPTLSLRVERKVGQQVQVKLIYHRRDTQIAPRSMEAFIEFDEKIKLTQATPLQSVREAEKELVVQEREPGVIRLMIYATTNLNVLESGPLALLTLEGSTLSQSYIHVRERLPLFAPASANEGVIFEAPVRFEVRR